MLVIHARFYEVFFISSIGSVKILSIVRLGRLARLGQRASMKMVGETCGLDRRG